MEDETLVNHQPRILLDEKNPPLVCPVYHSVKYTVESMRDLERLFAEREGRYIYSRSANPTVRQLELLLAKLQGTEEAIALGSGIAALSACFLSLLKPNDHVVLFYESYKPTRYLIRSLLAKFGVQSSLLSLTHREGIERAIEPGRTKLVIFESPTNPMVRIADIEHLTRLAKRAGALTLLDNTFAGLHNHRELPIDLYVHSLTKFAVGHGDAMGGAILGPKALIDNLRADSRELGAVLDPNAAYLTLRGLKTYYLRYQKQCENALAVAQFLEGHSQVERVFYPGLLSHPEHLLAKRQMKDFGTVLAVNFKGGKKTIESFLERVKLFQIAASLGSTESLVMPALMFYASDLSKEELDIVEINDGSVRFAIGIESHRDLIEDLSQALNF